MQTLIDHPTPRTSRVLELSAREIENALKAFDRIDQKKNQAEDLYAARYMRSGRIQPGRRLV